ncbi:MAG TPA: MarR family transcriptional regulator [Thermoanaerobaculia bacterium]|nr:MarR family transcriptional regulator [Thermoanaerobaculia bacterium]
MPIAEELKQSRPFPAKSQEAAVALMRTADLVRRAVAAVIEPRGITTQQYNVLRILRGAGERGLPTLEIAERMIEQTPGITRLIDRLESKRLVSRERCTTDRRQVFCRIRSEGLELLETLDKPLAESEQEALGSMGQQDLLQLVELLDRARTGLSAALLAPRTN